MNDYYDSDDRKAQAMEQMPVLLTPLEVMDILGVGKNTVYRLLNSGELKGVRIGKKWRIANCAIKSYLM